MNNKEVKNKTFISNNYKSSGVCGVNIETSIVPTAFSNITKNHNRIEYTFLQVTQENVLK